MLSIKADDTLPEISNVNAPFLSALFIFVFKNGTPFTAMRCSLPYIVVVSESNDGFSDVYFTYPSDE